MSDDPTPVATTKAVAPVHTRSKGRRGPMALGFSQQ